MPQNKGRIRRISQVLVRLVGEATRTKQFVYSGDSLADRFLRENPFAFLLGVIADQQIQAERAWRLPFLLRNRLDHLHPAILGGMEEQRLADAIGTKPALHRFTHTMARWFIGAAKRVTTDYRGQAQHIWNDTPSAATVIERLTTFEGIGQKKATMAVKMLLRDRFALLGDRSGIDLSYDVHVRRVLLRSGVARTDTVDAVVAAGRALHPTYPGFYDDAIWLIGRRHCHPSRPDHDGCPLGSVCPQLNKNATA